MVSNAETHHYIKNILQAIISYSNTCILSGSAVTKDSIVKLNNFIHVIAFVQDLVFKKEPLNFKENIPANRVLEKAANILSDKEEITLHDLPEMECGVKKTTNLALIFVEILSYLKKIGASSIEISVTEGENKNYMMVINSRLKEGTSTPGADIFTKDLKLAGLLAKSELNAVFTVESAENLIISSGFFLT